MDIKYSKDTSKTNEDIEPKFGVWYSIECAPKDKRILTIDEGGEVSVAYYDKYEGWYIPREENEKCYDAYFGGELYTAILEPLYWMPLPPTP